MERQFNQIKYINEYNKQNYKRFGTNLKKEEVEKANKLLKKHGLNKADLIRKALKRLEEFGEI